MIQDTSYKSQHKNDMWESDIVALVSLSSSVLSTKHSLFPLLFTKNLKKCIQTVLFIRELRRTDMYEPTFLLKQSSKGNFYPLLAWIQKHKHEMNIGHLDKREERMGEEVDFWHHVTDQMTPMKTFWIYCWKLHIVPFTQGRPTKGSLWSFQWLSSIQSCKVNRKGLSSSVITRKKDTDTRLKCSHIYFLTSSCFCNLHLHKCESAISNQCLANVPEAPRCVYVFFVSTYTGAWHWPSIKVSCLGFFAINGAKLRPAVNMQYKHDQPQMHASTHKCDNVEPRIGHTDFSKTIMRR